jgi:hypothetical protein
VLLYLSYLIYVANNAFDDESTSATTVVGSAGSFGEADGTGASAQFKFPYAMRLSVDGTFALVSDRGVGFGSFNDRVRKIDTSTFSVTTIAGSNTGDLDSAHGTSSQFDSIGGIGIAADGSFAVVADSTNNKLKRIELTGTHQVSTIAGSGVAGTGIGDDGIGILAQLNRPTGCDVSRDGCFAVFTEQYSARIRTLTLKAGCAAPFDVVGEVKPLAGEFDFEGDTDGIGADARFKKPQQVAIYPSGAFAVVADTMNHRIRKIFIGHSHPYIQYLRDPGGWSHGQVVTLAGSVGGSLDGSHNVARFYEPAGLDFSPTYDFVLVADTGNNQIRRVDLVDGFVNTVAGSAATPGLSVDGPAADARFNTPADVVVAPDSSWALVVGRSSRVIRALSLTRPFPSSVPTASPTPAPTPAPTTSPTAAPTAAPTDSPTASPTAAPTRSPTQFPTFDYEVATYVAPDPPGTTALGSPGETAAKMFLFILMIIPICCFYKCRQIKKRSKAKKAGAFMALGRCRRIHGFR